MDNTESIWYKIFDFPAMYNSVRYILLFGSKKIFSQVKSNVDLQDEESLLDVGCGTGDFSKLFDGNYTGLDYSNKYADYCSKKYPDKKFLQGDVMSLSYSDKSFDKVLLASFIHHFTDEEVHKMLKEISRVTRKKIVLVEPLPLKNPISWFLLKMDRGADIRSVERLRSLISENFEIEKVVTFYSGFYKKCVINATPKN